MTRKPTLLVRTRPRRARLAAVWGMASCRGGPCGGPGPQSANLLKTFLPISLALMALGAVLIPLPGPGVPVLIEGLATSAVAGAILWFGRGERAQHGDGPSRG